MTLTDSSPAMFLSATVFVAKNEEGKTVIDMDTTVEAFKASVLERFEREGKSQADILAVLNKFSTERVSTDDVLDRVVKGWERAENRKRLIEADDDSKVEDFEYTPSQRKAHFENLNATLESMKAAGIIVAKAGKGGGIQTAANDKKLPVKSKA